MPTDDTLSEILLRIDQEIEALLRHGKLSSLDYGLPVSKAARCNRTANLKALLAVRRHYRETRSTSSLSPHPNSLPRGEEQSICDGDRL